MAVSVHERELGMGTLEASRAQMTSSDGNNTGTRPSMLTNTMHLNSVSGGVTSTRTRRPSIPGLDLSGINQTRISSQENVQNGYVHSRHVSVADNRNALQHQQNGGASRTRSSNSQTTRPHRLDPSIRHTDRMIFQAVTRENVRMHESSRARRDDSRSPYHERSRSHRDHNFRGVGSATTNRSTEAAASGDESYIVPVMPMPIAVLCCVLNFLIPGFGSILASICMFCCARTDDMKGREKLCTCCTVFGIGILQLLLVACFLIGWIWSCIWGVSFIGVSASYYGDGDDAGSESYQQQMAPNNNPAYQRHARGRTPLPAPQVVVDQPFPGVRYEDLERHDENRRHRSSRPRRSPRLPLTPSNLIYPMRAPSNIAYSSPPPSYTEAVTHLPGQIPDNGAGPGHMERPPSYHSTVSSHQGRGRSRVQAGDTIPEEAYR